MTRVLFIFLDGVGIGADDPARNPFIAAPPPTITSLVQTGAATIAPLDALLGGTGLPQSGTGQYTLLTGENGVARFGRHHGPFVPTALRQPLMQNSVLARAVTAGRNVAFATAYPEELIEAAIATGPFKPVGPLRAAPPLAAAGAGLLTRHTAALMRGDAVASEILNTGWRERLNRLELPIITAADAGRNLARIANQHDLTFFAHYATDEAGHAQDLDQAIAALKRVDEFLGGVVAELEPELVMIIASDHGNIEDITGDHTLNPALGLVYGPGHVEIASRLRSLTDVTPTILRILGVPNA